MTLDEAIKHAEEVADEKKKDACNLYGVQNYEESRECIWCSEEHRQLAEWLKELKQLREQTEWIPVSERLPNHDEYIKNNGLFNVSDGNRSYSERFDFYGKQRFGELTQYGFRFDRAVTAWMPLPEKYKAEIEPQESEDKE